MIDFVGKKYIYLLISLIIIIPGMVFLGTFGMKWGIEFTGGSSMNIHFTSEVNESELRAAFSELGHPEVILQRSLDEKTNTEYFFVRINRLKAAEKDDKGNIVKPSERETLEKDLQAKFGEMQIKDPYEVDSTIARELRTYASIAVAVAAVGILLYITWAFRKMPQPFRWGTCAVVALIHDVLVVTGVFAILGKVANMQIDPMFITGLLTVVGYSVHDTIVVFDRLRENVSKGISRDFEITVNASIMETMGRSLNTALTTLFVLVAILLFGGETIRGFVLVMLIGIITGTYSSIFIAAQLLVFWHKGEWRKLTSWVSNRRGVVRG